MNPQPSELTDVYSVRVLDIKGPWETKSGGRLSSLFNLPRDILESEFFDYGSAELSEIPEDIRGLRAYIVECLPAGKIGANEWHKLRHELVFAIRGKVQWTCTDAFGHKKQFNLDGSQGVWVRPYILHAYKALEEGSSLLVITNTLFMPDKPETYDTYSADSFVEITSRSD